MKELEIKAIQKFLATRKLPVPVTGQFDAATISAYQAYRGSIGIAYPLNTYLPSSRKDLSHEMKLYVDMMLEENDSAEEIQEPENNPVPPTNSENQNEGDGDGEEDLDLDLELDEDLDEELVDALRAANNDGDSNPDDEPKDEQNLDDVEKMLQENQLDQKSNGIIDRLTSLVKPK